MISGARRAGTYLRELLEKPDAPKVAFRYRDIGFFLRFVKPVWKMGALALVLLLVAAAMASLLPLSSKILIDFVIMGKEPQGVARLLSFAGLERFAEPVTALLGSLNHLVAAILLISVAAGATAVMQRYLMIRFQQELTFNLQASLLEQVLRFPLQFFREKQTGYLMSRLSDDVGSLQNLFAQRSSQLASNIFYLIFGVIILFNLSAKLSLIAICILPLYLTINFYFAGRMRRRSRNVMESRAQVSKDLQETLAGIEVVKSFAAEDVEHLRVTRRLRDVIRERINFLMLSFFSGGLMKSVQLLSTLIIMWFGVREILRGGMTLGDFVAFNSYLIYLSGPVQGLATFHLTLQPIFASLDRLLELFQMPAEEGMEKGAPRRARLDRVRGDVAFQEVTFAYREGHPVLANITFTARKGEVVALVGPSGAGKSTLVSLVLAFSRPAAGKVLLDGHDLRDLDLRWLRRQVGYVSQEGLLFADTIRNNIKYGRAAATDAEIIAAARKAHIHDDIMALPDGYDTIAGERGTQLSVGQKQRVSIARVFLKDPPILIFDEPTSALDANSEALLKESLRDLIGERTTLIIAHRLSTIDFADTILVLDKGLISDRGTHERLVRQCDLYRTLYETQFPSQR